MTLDELEEMILIKITDIPLSMYIIDAFEKYSESLTAAKPIVSGSLPPLFEFVEAWGKENKRLTREYVYDSAGGSEAFISEAAIQEWLRRQ